MTEKLEEKNLCSDRENGSRFYLSTCLYPVGDEVCDKKKLWTFPQTRDVVPSHVQQGVQGCSPQLLCPSRCVITAQPLKDCRGRVCRVRYLEPSACLLEFVVNDVCCKQTEIENKYNLIISLRHCFLQYGVVCGLELLNLRCLGEMTSTRRQQCRDDKNLLQVQYAIERG